MNIPVIPMDHVFKDHYKYCEMGDGIHLNFNCMMTEQQHIWNVVLLLRRHRVRQGLGTVSHEGGGLPNAKQFLNETRYDEWKREMDMIPSGAASMPVVPTPPTTDSPATTDEAEFQLGVVEQAAVPTSNKTTETTTSPAAVSVNPGAPIELHVIVTDASPSPLDHKQRTLQKSMQSRNWSSFIFSTALLVAVALYLWWAASGPRKEWGALLRFD